MEIDMQDCPSERRMLNFLHEREPALPSDLQLDQNIFAGRMAEQGIDVAPRNLERFRFVLRSVHYRRHGAGRLQFPHG